MQLWKLPASSNWSFNFESEELLEEFLRFLCHLVRARAATVEASVPEVAYKGQCSSVFSPRVYFSRTGLPVYSNIFFTTRQPPLHRNSQNHRQQEDGNPEADSASSLGQSLHFLCKCPEEKERKGKKKKKRNILLGETFKSRDPLLHRHSLKGKIRWSNLFTVLPPHHPPTPIKAVFLFRALRGPVLSNSLVIQSCFQMCLRVFSAKSAAAGCQDRFRGLNRDENLALLICDGVLCRLLFLPVITRSRGVWGRCLGNSASAGLSSMHASWPRRRLCIGLDNICTNFMPIKVRLLKQARSLSHSYYYCLNGVNCEKERESPPHFLRWLLTLMWEGSFQNAHRG